MDLENINIYGIKEIGIEKIRRLEEYGAGGGGSGPKTSHQSRMHLVDMVFLMGSAAYSGGQLGDHGLAWLALRRRRSVETKKEQP